MKRPLLRTFSGVFFSVILLASFFAVSTVISTPIQDPALWQYVSSWHRLQTGFLAAVIFGLLFGGERLTESFSGKGFGKGLLASSPVTVFSAVCIALLILDFRAFDIDNTAYFIGDVFVLAAATSFFEELVLRGLMIEGYYLIKHQNRLTRLIFVFLAAAIFAACHPQYYASPLSLFKVFALGFSLSAAYLYSRNLMACTVIHFLYDVAVCLLRYSENGSSPPRLWLSLSLDYIYIAMVVIGLVFVFLKKPYAPKALTEDTE